MVAISDGFVVVLVVVVVAVAVPVGAQIGRKKEHESEGGISCTSPDEKAAVRRIPN